MKSVTVSAPGKIHLMGEHAIVHNKPALLSAINLRMTVTVETSESMSNKTLEIKCSDAPDMIKKCVEIIKKSLRVNDNQSLRIAISAEFPSGYHLGSSAAVAVALTGALMKFYTGRFDKKEINEIAYRVEKLFHGNVSGGDNTTVTYGGLLWYRKETEFLKLFSPITLPTAGLTPQLQNFFLIDSGRPVESTKEMISAVQALFDKNDRLKKQVLDDNEQATKKVLESLYTDNESLLLEALREGEQTLEAMQVVSKKVMPLIRDIEKLGGSAKILGGGGKKDGVGYLLCYYRHTEYERGKQLLSDLAKKYSYTLRGIRLGEEGIRIEATE